MILFVSSLLPVPLCADCGISSSVFTDGKFTRLEKEREYG